MPLASPRRVALALVASVGLNLFLGGIVAGRLLAPPFGGGPHGPPPRPAMIVGEIARALGPDDAKILREEFDRQPKSRVDVERLHGEIAQILKTEPFDETAFRAAITRAEAAADEGKSSILNAVTAAMGKISPEGRRRLAELRPPGG